jgi:hypothetical protein
MIKVLIRHSGHVFTQLQEEGKTTHMCRPKKAIQILIEQK